MTYVLTPEDAGSEQRDSGDSQPELGINKAGDGLLRSLLVQIRLLMSVTPEGNIGSCSCGIPLS
jgi:hypothetical protein